MKIRRNSYFLYFYSETNKNIEKLNVAHLNKLYKKKTNPVLCYSPVSRRQSVNILYEILHGMNLLFEEFTKKDVFLPCA